MSRPVVAGLLRASSVLQGYSGASRHACATFHQVAAQGVRQRSAQPTWVAAWQAALLQTAAAQAPSAARGFAALAVGGSASATACSSSISSQLRCKTADAAARRIQALTRPQQRQHPQSAAQRRRHATAQPATPAPAVPPRKPPAAPPAKLPAPPQRSVWQQTRDAVTAPGRAVHMVGGAGGRALSAVYRVSPSPVRRLVDSARSGTAQKVLSLQLEAFWQQHRNKVFILGGVAVVYILWKSLFGVASIFVNLSETMAELGFLAFAAALVAFAGLYLRHRFSINPRAVYRQAMVKLNTSPSVLEVMGPPLAGSDVRAYVMTGGGVRLKGLLPRYRSRRVQMIFPLRGTQKRGLVSLEAKRRKGSYVFKLLAVDVPTASSAEQRLYVEGDSKLYHRGGVINELRDPFLQALSLTKAYEEEDEADDEAEEEAEQRDRAAAARAQAAALPKPMDQGGGMFFYERVYWGARGFLDRLFSGKPSASSPPGTATDGKAPSATPEVRKEQTQQSPPAAGQQAVDPAGPAGSSANPLIQRAPVTAS